MDIRILINEMHGGGAEKVAAILHNHFSSKKMGKLVMLYDGESSYQLIKPYDIISEEVFGNSLCRVFKNCIHTFIKYLKYLKAEKPDAVISILVPGNLCNIISSLFTKTIPIVSYHGMPSTVGVNDSKLLGFLVRILPKVRVIAVSNGVKEDLIRIYNISESKIKVLYNPVETGLIRELSQGTVDETELTLFSDIPTIITVGGLRYIKAQHHLIRSFAALRHERPARLLICGAGDEEAYLKSLTKDLGVADAVVFLGWQENPYKYMGRSTVFVLSSISEALPNVLTEAMASGCPVITADCSIGVREIIGNHNEYGLLAEAMTGVRHPATEPLDVGEKSLLTLMRKVIDDAELREEYVRRGKERAEFFSVERRIKEYEEFVLECMTQ